MIKNMSALMFLFFLIIATTSYQSDGNILKLTENDFDSAKKEFPHLLVKFFTPWYFIFFI